MSKPKPMSKREFRELERRIQAAEWLLIIGLVIAECAVLLLLERNARAREEVKRWRTATGTGKGASAGSAASQPATPAAGGSGGGGGS